MTRNVRLVTRTDSLAAAGVLDLMSFTFPPNDPHEKTSLSAYVLKALLDVLKGRLSSADSESFRTLLSGGDATLDSVVETRLFEGFDEVLIEQAAVLGWRMYESDVVMARLAIWSDYNWDGIEKLKRFNAAINRYAEVKRGMAQQPFTEPEWYQTRKSALQEIKALCEELSCQSVLRKRRRVPDLTDQYAEIRTRIAANPFRYRYLTSNLTSFMDYLERHDSASETASPLTRRFVTRQITPAAVLDGWFDYQGSTAEGKSRQIISRIGSRKRL